MRTCLPIHVLAILASLSAFAHDGDTHGEAENTVAKATPSHHVRASINVRHLDAPNTWPTALPLPGIGFEQPRGMLYGDSSLAWQATWLPWLQTEISTAYDDNSKRFETDHVTLGLQYRTANDQKIALSLGRQSPLDTQPAWALPTLRDTALIGHDHWHDDGAKLTVQQGAWQGTLGAYSGRGYPGAKSANTIGAWLSGIQWRQGHWALQADIGYLPKLERITQADNHAGHSHSHSGGCGIDRDCLRGHGWLGLMKAGWQQGAIYLTAEAGKRRENGEIAGQLGIATYQGDTTNLALEAGWHWTDTTTLAARHEQLALHHQLKGPGANTLATQAGIANSEYRPQRNGLRLNWQATATHSFAVEAWQDRTQTGHQNLFLTQWRYAFDLAK
ncbi:hypothetical protein [Chitinimonas sp. BJB300]|uniref:hypothetical protein n=1 Tax=Chitinimonas sp. BJB300 TaxID=1559339 RepID=UPI000C0D22E7|nr:hypothetical protein [Chitinimonas sp. BJB300]PHV11053.1 hypothetical protein CSQ89_12975 [Chitinimonas sp. BJB300]TSJ90081.1 hypothetical protein FG002_007805 [Chitinimonas sp. BJB300]